MRLREAIGRAIGGVFAPLAALGGLIRGARLFHPEGVVYRAQVTPIATEGAVGELAQRLAGPALVRFSGALWRRAHRAAVPEILGAAVRFTRNPKPEARAAHGDQDLLFATIPSILLLPLAPFTTNRRDFLANTYNADLPFFVEGLGQVKFRLTTSNAGATGEDRLARLEHAVKTGRGALHLEVRRRRGLWIPVAAIELRERADIDQEALRLNPFRSGRGIIPVGLLQSIRAAIYPASQIGRRAARGPR